MKKNPWFRFLILQCCAVTVSVSQLKVSAVMAQVAQGFSISMGAAAGLMSFFTVAGIVLAIPGAALMERMGAKRLLLLLMACLFAGNAVGAVAGAYPLLMDMFGESDAAHFYARNPASVFGIAGRGAIAPGYFADLVLASRTPYTVHDCDVVSKCGWTYLDGTTLGHSISRVWLNGRENGHPRHLTFGTGH